MLHLRLDDWELQELHNRAALVGCSTAELTRAHLFDRPVQGVTPCSSKPHNCNPQHKDMVTSYRDQRYRDEQEQEARTGNYAGDIAHERATGHRMVTFGEWLRAHRR